MSRIRHHMAERIAWSHRERTCRQRGHNWTDRSDPRWMIVFELRLLEVMTRGLPTPGGTTPVGRGSGLTSTAATGGSWTSRPRLLENRPRSDKPPEALASTTARTNANTDVTR